MKRFYSGVIRFRYGIMIFFFIAALLGGCCKKMVKVDYDMNDYLPESSPSTVALDVMDQEFGGAIPNARVMVKAKDKKEALDYKKSLENIDGVTSVMWLDDALPVDLPFSMYPEKTLNTYYKDGYALFQVTIEEDKRTEVVPEIYELIGDENAATGSAVSTALATATTLKEVQKISIIAVLFLVCVLVFTTTSWIEPLVVLIGLGVAILMNAGSNLIFGQISFVTNAAGNILQLAVSLDYSVFLIHRFDECRETAAPEEAMQKALVLSTKSILSSGLTAVIGFLALVMMRFEIGSDLGLALAKGIAISLLTVFLFMPGLILVSFKWMDKTRHKVFMPSFQKLGKFISRTKYLAGIIFICLIIPSYIASNSNTYYYGASHIFGSETRLGKDTAKIEKIFGKNDNYVLMVPKDDTVTETKFLDELENMNKIKSITALHAMIGPAVPASSVPDTLLKKLQSENYDRIVLNVDAEYEGEATFELVEKIRETAEKYYQDKFYLAGEGVSTYDLMDTITDDMVKVNLLAIGAVFIVLLFTMRSVILPVILVLTIETAIWMNLSIPYIKGQSIFYIAYLLISSIQLGATVDYAILFTERYKENRQKLNKKESIVETVSNVTVSILTSGLTLTVVGFLLGMVATHGLLSQLGYFLGRGTIFSMVAVLFVLPCFLYVADGIFVKRK